MENKEQKNFSSGSLAQLSSRNNKEKWPRLADQTATRRKCSRHTKIASGSVALANGAEVVFFFSEERFIPRTIHFP